MPTPRRALRRRVGQFSLMVALVALAATLAVVVSPGGGGRTIAAIGDPLGAGGEYHPLKPTRILDTRRANLDVAPLGAKQTGTNVTFNVPLVGKGGLPADASHVLAVVANVTVAAPTRAGHLTIYPKGSTPGLSSVVNFGAGQAVANSTILRPGQDGQVTLQLVTPAGAGTANVIIDISGWFSTSSPTAPRGARVIPVEPTRAYDSSDHGGNRRGTTHIPIDLRSRAAGLGVPGSAGDVTGVIVNLTGVNAFAGSRNTHLAVVPGQFNLNDKTTHPTTSNLNLVPGQTRANLVVVPLGPDGRVHIFNLQGEVRVVVDVVGFLVANRPENTRAGRVIPLVTPFRALDTRRPEFYDQPLGPGRAEDFSFQAFTGDVRIGAEHVGKQSGLFGNLTAVGLERQYTWGPPERSHMTVYPTPTNGSTTPPKISNLNLTEGEAVPNLALLRYGGGTADPRIRFFNFAGYVDYLLDVSAVVLAD